MIEYIIPANPDDRVIKRAISFIQEGEVIAFPTDTSWVLAASPFHKNGLENIRRIKSMEEGKHLSLICESLSQISQYAEVTTFAFRIMKRFLPGPYTFILHPNKNLPRYIKSYHKAGEIGVRIPQSVLCSRLVHFMEGPLLTTSISCELLGMEIGDIYSYQIEDSLGGQLKMIIDPGELELLGPSTVVSLTIEGELSILREGAGSTEQLKSS